MCRSESLANAVRKKNPGVQLRIPGPSMISPLGAALPQPTWWWVEDVFGLEYDLDLFNIVAVDDFNMGERGCRLGPLSAAVACAVSCCTCRTAAAAGP